MKNKLSALSMILVVTISIFSIPIPTNSSPAVINVPADYPTIQAAVGNASSGDTIIVAAGTYAGAIVDKNVTISGASGGASVITSGVPYKTGSSLYTAFRLDDTADGAEIRGFTISCNSTEGFYFAVFSRNADNVVADSLTVNDAVQGITNWGGSNWEITNNVLNNTEAAGGGGIAIFLGAYPPNYPVCSGTLIQNNTITAAATAPDYTCPGIGVGLDLRWGAYDDLTGSEDLSNNRILDNNITAPGALNGVGIEIGVIGLEGNATKIAATLGTIHDNTIQLNNIEGADFGIYFYTVTNMEIEQNEIKDCNEGIHIKDGISGNIINYNNIFGNAIGINNTAGELIDARFNWWGDTSGPYHNDTNLMGLGDEVTNNVTYSPWLGDVFETTPRTYHVNPTGTIQEGVNEASPSETIMVHDGTYNEALYINKSLTIKAASTPVINGSQSVTTSYGPRDAVIFVEDSTNVVLEGLDIEGYGLGTTNPKSYAIIYENSSGRITDCIVSPNTVGDMNGAAIGAWDSSDLTVDPSTIKNFGRIGIFYFDGCSGGVYNSTIIGQVYTDIDYVCYGIEVEAYNYACDIEINGNEIYNCSNTNVPPTWTSAGILIDGWLEYFYTPSSTVVIEENDIHDNYIGIDVVANSISHAYNNNIYNNTAYGVHSAPDYANNNVTFNARYNWWGDPWGPSTSPPAGDKVSDYVDFEPWLLEPYPPATPVETLLYIDPAKVEFWTPSYDRVFRVDVKIANVTELTCYEFKLYWNTTLLDFDYAYKVEIWPLQIEFEYIDESLGRYWLAVAARGEENFTGSETLVELYFKIKYDPIYPDNAYSLLNLNETVLGDTTEPTPQPIVHMVHDGEYWCYSTKPKMKVEPPTSTAKKLDKTFDVNITVQDIVNLYEFEFSLYYNTTLLDAEDVVLGPFLNEPTVLIEKHIHDNYNSTHGLVRFAVKSQSPAPSANGTGVLATITFKVTNASIWPEPDLECALGLDSTKLKTIGGIEVLHDKIDGLYRYKPVIGDLNSDGTVDLDDLYIISLAFGSRPGDLNWNKYADLTRDGVVNVLDLRTAARHFGEDC